MLRKWFKLKIDHGNHFLSVALNVCLLTFWSVTLSHPKDRRQFPACRKTRLSCKHWLKITPFRILLKPLLL